MPTFPEIINEIDLYPDESTIVSDEGIEVYKISTDELRVSVHGITHTYVFNREPAILAGA